MITIKEYTRVTCPDVRKGKVSNGNVFTYCVCMFVCLCGVLDGRVLLGLREKETLHTSISGT